MKFLESRGQQPLEALIPRYAVRGGRLAALAAFPPARAPAPAPAPAAQQ